MKLTIFTPTYNRSYCLQRLYSSLLLQTRSEFEWLIVDDGSTDNTHSLIDSFISENRIHIRYYFKINGGKHTAYNLGLSKAQGEYFMCVDSDDWLPANAVETILAHENKLINAAGIIAQKVSSSGDLLCNKFPRSILFSNLFKLDQYFGCSGEFALVFKTKLAALFPFPVFPAEKFMTECVVYDLIDRTYDFLLLSVPLSICEYQSNGYSANFDRLAKQNPLGFCLYHMQRIDMVSGLFSKVIVAGKYWCFRFFSKAAIIPYNGRHRVLTAICIPLGWVFLLYYKLFRNF